MALFLAVIALVGMWVVGFFGMHWGLFVHAFLAAALVLVLWKFYKPIGSPY